MSNMLNFKYEIQYHDETGRPYINISNDEENHQPEHKFMAIELTRYLLIQLLKDNESENEMSDQEQYEVVKAEELLQYISDQMAGLIIGQNNAFDDLGLDIQDDE